MQRRRIACAPPQHDLPAADHQTQQTRRNGGTETEHNRATNLPLYVCEQLRVPVVLMLRLRQQQRRGNASGSPGRSHRAEHQCRHEISSDDRRQQYQHDQARMWRKSDRDEGCQRSSADERPDWHPNQYEDSDPNEPSSDRRSAAHLVQPLSLLRRVSEQRPDGDAWAGNMRR